MPIVLETKMDKHIEILKERIAAEVAEMLRSYREENITFCNDLLSKGKSEKETIFYTKYRLAKKGGKCEHHIKAIAGSPLYIALFLKRYGDAEQILRENPETSNPGYAAIPVSICCMEEDGKEGYREEIDFSVMDGIYLEKLVFTDPEIPEHLFRELCRTLKNRFPDEIDLPNYYRDPMGYSSDSPADMLPVFFQELPNRSFLEKEYGSRKEREAKTTGRLPSFLKRKKSGSDKVSTETALCDMKDYRNIIKGLYRLKKTEEDIWQEFMHDNAAGYLFLAYILRLCGLIAAMGTKWMAEGREYTHLSEIKGEYNAKKEFISLRMDLQRIGIDKISAGQLWEAMEDELHASSGSDAMYYHRGWLCFDIWKAVFGEKLIFPIGSSQKTLLSGERRKLLGLFGLKPAGRKGYEWVDEHPKDFLRVLDRVDWQNEDKLTQEYRRQLERLVIEKGDPEYLLLCFEKDLIPERDADILVGYLTKEDTLQALLPLIIMQKHGGFRKNA